MSSFLKFSNRLFRIYSISNGISDFPYNKVQFRKSHVKRPSENSHKSEYLFGIHSVNHALRCKKRSFYELFIEDDLPKYLDSYKSTQLLEICQLAELLNIPVKRQLKEFMDKISNSSCHQGVILKCSNLPFLDFDQICLSDILNNKPGIIVFLDEIKDIMNFSHLLRTCAFFGVISVLLPSENTCSPCPVISTISQGAMETIPIYRVHDKMLMLNALKNANCLVIGTSGNDVVAAKNICEFTPTETKDMRGRHSLLILGREDLGMTPEVYSLCDLILKIPQGNQEKYSLKSLNVCTAGGLLLHFLDSINKC